MTRVIGFFHDLYHGFMFWLEGEWRYLMRFKREMIDWALFALCLAALCFTLGFSDGVIFG